MIYRKWGRVVRWEDGHLVRVEEAGEAREEGGRIVAVGTTSARTLETAARGWSIAPFEALSARRTSVSISCHSIG